MGGHNCRTGKHHRSYSTSNQCSNYAKPIQSGSLCCACHALPFAALDLLGNDGCESGERGWSCGTEGSTWWAVQVAGGRAMARTAAAALRPRVGWCRGAGGWAGSARLGRIGTAGRGVSGRQDGQLGLPAALRGAEVGRDTRAHGSGYGMGLRRWGRAAGCAQERGGGHAGSHRWRANDDGRPAGVWRRRRWRRRSSDDLAKAALDLFRNRSTSYCGRPQLAKDGGQSGGSGGAVEASSPAENARDGLG